MTTELLTIALIVETSLIIGGLISAIKQIIDMPNCQHEFELSTNGRSKCGYICKKCGKVKYVRR